ncbi:hypothetical protein [Streptomyces sp. I6]|uniref:hypothetical protein n=1 Tax=Streptomyces sp. I6 TaxID=2483113 RepID=UPI0011CDBD09|nr:hypothetical protein [Streptomyces sp. I6]
MQHLTVLRLDGDGDMVGGVRDCCRSAGGVWSPIGAVSVPYHPSSPGRRTLDVSQTCIRTRVATRSALSDRS